MKTPEGGSFDSPRPGAHPFRAHIQEGQVVRYGRFVMNTRDEIEQAFRDHHAGKMGSLADTRQ